MALIRLSVAGTPTKNTECPHESQLVQSTKSHLATSNSDSSESRFATLALEPRADDSKPLKDIANDYSRKSSPTLRLKEMGRLQW